MNQITREKLESLLRKACQDSAVVTLFQSAEEANRRDLAPIALAWYRCGPTGAIWNGLSRLMNQ